MRKPDLNRIVRLQKKTQQLKTYANELANQLIVEFDINDGFQMAYFLRVSQGLDNYTAIRVWTQKWLGQHYPLDYASTTLIDLQQDDTVYTKLKHQFLTHFPEVAVAC